MVITTPFITTFVEEEKPHKKLFPPSESDITVVVREKGVRDSWKKTFRDVDVMKKRVEIGRVGNSSLQIDHGNVSRLHAVIECSPKDGKWTFRDIESLNGSIVNGHRLHPTSTHELAHGDRIKIGKYRWKLCHTLEISMHFAVDDLPKVERPPPPRKRSWRRSMYCNACMGYGPKHGCILRVSVLRRLILDANRKSNVTAPRIPKTWLQKDQMRRLSYWWERKAEEERKKRDLVVPQNYDDDPKKSVKRLPAVVKCRPPTSPELPLLV